MGLDTLLSARALMALSFVFHTFFTPLGIGLPLLLFIAEGIGLKTGDARFRQLARAWTPAVGLLFAVGAVSGTVLSFELGLLWPRFMEYAGGIIGYALLSRRVRVLHRGDLPGNLHLWGDRLSPGPIGWPASRCSSVLPSPASL